MKTAVLSLALMLTSSLLLAQSDAYKQAMTDALATMKKQDEKTPVPDMLAVASQFERIAGAEASEWLPRYYAGLMYVYLGFSGKDMTEKDKFLDSADRFLKEAEALKGKADELAVLKAYIAQSRLTVDPMNRWQNYGAAFQQAIDEALKINPDNPRPYVLQSTALMYTPEEYGGGPKTACPMLKKAAEKIAAFKPASELDPSWGRELTEIMLTRCNK